MMIPLRSLFRWTLMFTALLTAITLPLKSSQASFQHLEVILKAGDYRIDQQGDGSHLVQMQDFGSLLIPGKPKLPARVFSIALPPGARVTSVTFQPDPPTPIPGTYHIAPIPPTLPLIKDEHLEALKTSQWQRAHRACYGSDSPFPERPVLAMGEGALRRYNFVRVAFFPLTYEPQSQKLWLTRQVEMRVNYRLADQRAQERGLVEDMAAEELAAQLLVNYSQAKSWYPQMAQATSLHDYVVITTPELAPSVVPLTDWKTAIGRTPWVVTTTWIDSIYSGDDLAQKIRNFLRDKYPQPQWGIQDVLIVSGVDDIPMRTCYVDTPSHSYPTPTDYYYAELSQPDSLSWDSDGDGYYGEYQEDEIDFAPEVYVGRIPFNDTTKVRTICEKLVDFERDTGSWKRRALLLGAMANYENEDLTGWPRTDGAALMEVTTDSLLSGWNVTKMYEEAGIRPCTYPHDAPLTKDNVEGDWSTGRYAVVNWSSHGNNMGAYRKYWASDDGDSIPESGEMSSAAFLNLSSASLLDDDYPSIVFAASCSNGKPEGPSLGKSLLGNGSSGIVAASRLAWYSCGWTEPDDGGIASIDYHFFRYLLSEGQTVGQALYHAKVYYHDFLFEAYPGDDIWSPQQNMMALNLYGDPSLIPEGVDIAPPAVVADLKAILCDSAMVLEWSAVTEDLYGHEEMVDHYIIYRNTSPDFVPVSDDSIGLATGTSFMDSDCGVGDTNLDHCYVIKAVDALGHKSESSKTVGEFDQLLETE